MRPPAAPMNMRDALTHQTGLGTAFGAPGEGLWAGVTGRPCET